MTTKMAMTKAKSSQSGVLFGLSTTNLPFYSSRQSNLSITPTLHWLCDSMEEEIPGLAEVVVMDGRLLLGQGWCAREARDRRAELRPENAQMRLGGMSACAVSVSETASGDPARSMCRTALKHHEDALASHFIISYVNKKEVLCFV
jgi:hypothetical protein